MRQSVAAAVRPGTNHWWTSSPTARSPPRGLSSYDAVYVALASLTGGVWLTADARAAAKVPRRGLVRVLGRHAAPR